MTLFGTGMPSPTQVRQNTAMTLASAAPMFANPGGAMIGLALGGAAGGLFSEARNPELRRAANLQKIRQSVSEKFGSVEQMTPDMFPKIGNYMAQELLKAGETEMAFSLIKEVGELQPATAEVSEGTQSAIRGMIISERKAEEKKASTMVESMKRINSLGDEARKGNRSARGTMVQQVARLAQGAGVITDRDAAAVTGDQDGFAFLLSVMMPNVDVDTQAALRGIDPLGPGFNTDNLLIVADSLLTSGRDSVNNRMADLQEQATEARFRPQGIKAMFAGNRNIDALNNLGAKKPAGKPKGDPTLRPFMSDEDAAEFTWE